MFVLYFNVLDLNIYILLISKRLGWTDKWYNFILLMLAGYPLVL